MRFFCLNKTCNEGFIIYKLQDLIDEIIFNWFSDVTWNLYTTSKNICTSMYLIINGSKSCIIDVIDNNSDDKKHLSIEH